jgi:hypothetical protein
MPDDIILIGPLRAGKSTLARLLGERLNRPNIILDKLRWDYYREIGYDDALAKRLRELGGFLSLAWYWKLFDAHAVERVLAEHRECVFDFGAGHSVYESRGDFARVEAALRPYPNVVLVLPSPSPDESIRVLNERTSDLPGTFAQGFNWNEYFVRHASNAALARFTVYTHGQTPEQACDDLLRQIGWQRGPAVERISHEGPK